MSYKKRLLTKTDLSKNPVNKHSDDNNVSNSSSDSQTNNPELTSKLDEYKPPGLQQTNIHHLMNNLENRH